MAGAHLEVLDGLVVQLEQLLVEALNLRPVLVVALQGLGRLVVQLGAQCGDGAVTVLEPLLELVNCGFGHRLHLQHHSISERSKMSWLHDQSA